MVNQDAHPTHRLRLWSGALGAGFLGLAVAALGLPHLTAAPGKDEPKKEESGPKDGKKSDLDRQIEDALKELEKKTPQAADVDPTAPANPLDPLQLQRELREAIQKMRGAGPGDIEKQMQEIQQIQKKMIEQMQRQIGAGAFPNVGGGFGGPGGIVINGAVFPGGGFQRVPAMPANASARLGVRLQTPAPAMADQLDLPAGEGLVIADVTPNSPAEKAGLKRHDILLEIGGAKVPNQLPAFQNQLRGLKSDEATDATVIRKGKRESIKGIKLVDAKEAPALPGGFQIQPFPGNIQIQPGGIQIVPVVPGQQVPNIQINPGVPGQPALPFPNIQFPNIQFPNIQLPNGIPGLPGAPGAPGAAVKAQAIVGGAGGSTAVSRSNDDFAIEHTNGDLKISIAGKVENGTPNPSAIAIQEGETTLRYPGLAQVPEKHKGQVERLLQGIR